MSYETEVAALTVAVNTLSSLAQTLDTTTQSAYNVAVATAQTHAVTATNQVALATTQKTLAASSASAAASSASQATTQAGIATTQASAATAAAVGASNIVLGVSTLYPNIRPNLDLDFANSQTVDPRITFTRASTATRTNARGLIEAVSSGVPRIDFDPVTGACKGLLIEEQRTNLLTYSEQFDSAAWVKTRATITPNVIAAPDGTLTTDKLVEDTTASNTHSIEQTYVFGAQTHSASVFAKAGERAWLRFLFADGATTFAAYFNLTTGAVGLAISGGATTKIEPVGNGWYRCTVTALTAAGAGYVRASLATVDGGASYTGDGTSGLFIWGAQLEAGAFPTSYQPSTETFTGRSGTATFIGSNGLIQTAASGVARMNYNPMNLTVAPKLVLEAAGTNLLTYSESLLNPIWTKLRATVATSAIAAPDGALTTTILSNNGIIDSNGYAAQNATWDGTSSYTFSVFLKANTITSATISFIDTSGVAALGNVDVNLTTGSLSGSGSVKATITQLPSGWQRVSVTAIPLVGAGFVRITLPTDATAGTDGIYIWGAQLEASTYPTSYIPTVASAVTRVADTSTSAQTTRAADVASMTGANFSSWWRADEGSFVAEYLLGADNSSLGLIGLDDGTSSNVLQMRYSSGGQAQFSVNSSGVNQVSLAPAGYSGMGAYKRTVTYGSAGFQQTINGVIPNPGVFTGTIPVLTLAFVGCEQGTRNFINGHVRSLSYYPKRLTSAELQALSTQ